MRKRAELAHRDSGEVPGASVELVRRASAEMMAEVGTRRPKSKREMRAEQ